MSSVLQNAILAGLGVGSVYALIGLGFSAIVKATGAFNFAQGELVAIGGLLAYTMTQVIGMPPLLAFVVVVLGVALIGAIEERVAILPLAKDRGDDHLAWLMTTLGVAVILTGIAQRVWGSEPLRVPSHLPFETIRVGSTTLPSSYVLSVSAVLVIATALELSQRYTRWGRVFRAMGENRQAVALAGVNVRRAALASFVLGGAIAGVGGFILAPITFAQSSGGLTLVLFGFACLAIGGFGSHWGALAGGAIVGISGSVGATYLGLQYQNIAVFAVLVLVLLVRPQGIAGAGNTRMV